MSFSAACGKQFTTYNKDVNTLMSQHFYQVLSHGFVRIPTKNILSAIFTLMKN